MLKKPLDTSPTRDLEIRFVKKEDAVQLIELQMHLADETDFLLRELDEVEIDAEKQRDNIRKILEDDDRFLIGAYEHNRLIGYLVGKRGSYARNNHVAKILLAVLKDYWGMGQAKVLMDTFLEWAFSMDISRVEVDVVEDNERARGFFFHYGFRIEGKKEGDHLTQEGRYLNTFLMAKRLKSDIM